MLDRWGQFLLHRGLQYNTRMPESLSNKNEKIPATAGAFLEKLRAGEAIPEDSKVAVVVAHQDDESIAFGGQISRFPGCMMVHVTDGAPEDPKEWQAKGFESQAAYADVRNREVNTALDIAGHTGPRESLNVTDQKVALQLAESAKTLATLFIKQGTKFALTHAYEGGHPDHDAVTFAVHAAKELMKQENLTLTIIEAPLYRREGSESVWQQFVPMEGTQEFALELNDEQRALKPQLFTAQPSQGKVFGHISMDTERLRAAPEYDFRQPANGGNLSHIFADAGLAESWTTLTDQALKSLRLTKPTM